MNALKEILAETGGGFFVTGFYEIAFSLLSLFSLVALANHVRLELATRRGFDRRALLMQSFFDAYDKRKKELEEAERELEREREKKRLEEMTETTGA